MSKSTFSRRLSSLIAEIAVDGTRPQRIERAMRRERRMGIAKGKREALAAMRWPGGQSTQLKACVERNAEKKRRGVIELEIHLGNVTYQRDEALKRAAAQDALLASNAVTIESQKWQLDTAARAIGQGAGSHHTLGGAIDSIRANESRLKREVARLDGKAARLESELKTAGQRIAECETALAVSNSQLAESRKTAVMPSSLKVDQRVEFTSFPSMARVTGIVREVGGDWADALFTNGDGILARLTDRTADGRAIRILHEESKEVEEFVKVPAVWDPGGQDLPRHSEDCRWTSSRACISACPRRIAWEAAGCPK